MNTRSFRYGNVDYLGTGFNIRQFFFSGWVLKNVRAYCRASPPEHEMFEDDALTSVSKFREFSVSSRIIKASYLGRGSKCDEKK